MAKILLVPDIFFHRWDKSDGELWICLRPFLEAPNASPPAGLGDLAAFHDWAKDPHASAASFSYYTPDTVSGQTCVRTGSDVRLVPINLPSSIDVWMRTTRGPFDPAPWTRVSRSTACLTAPSALKNDLGDLHPEPQDLSSKRASFGWWLNETVRRKHEYPTVDDAGSPHVLTDLEKDQLSAWLELRFESGKGVGWKHDAEIQSLYRNEADPAKPGIPLFTPDGPWRTQFSAGQPLHTNLFWLCGLMLPIGRKPVAADIVTITAIDIWLVDNSVPPDATAPDPSLTRFKLPIPPFSLLGPAVPYFAQISDSYAARLTCALEDPEILMNSTLPTTPGAGGPIAYFSPSIQSYSKAPESQLRNVWEFLSRMGTQSALSMGLGDPATSPKLLERRKLRDLVGLELRVAKADLPIAPPTQVLVPGIVVSGKLRPYRRFPRVVGSGVLLPTVMVFEPAADGADLLDKVSRRLGRPGLEQLVASAVLADGWSLVLLQTSPLPWDGPKQVYRVLAKPNPGGTQPNPLGPRTCDARSVTLGLRAPLSLSASVGAVTTPTNAAWQWLVKPDASITSIQALQQDWDLRAKAWSEMPINAFFVAGGDDLKADLNSLFLGDYNFFLANSRLRLEQTLGVYADLADSSPANCTPNQTPLQDFEDDLINYNTASAVTAQGKLLDGRVRFSQQARGQMLRELHRQQIIPLVFEWPHAPGNSLAENRNKSAAGWVEFRRFVRFLALDKSDQEPFSVQLEHSYSTTIKATDRLGVPIQLSRADAFDWAIDFPTNSEGSDFKENSVASFSFLTCRYDALAGAVSLKFDPALLNPAEMMKLTARDREGLALRAWRSLTEMLEAERLALQLELLLFDIGAQAGTSIASAASLARNGFTGHWRDALRDPGTFEVDLPAAERQKLNTWIQALLKTASPPFSPLELRVPVDKPNAKIGQLCHVVRARLKITRAIKHSAPQALRLAPITQQPGLTVAASNSLWDAWTQVGFGRSTDINALPTTEKQLILAAAAGWQSSLLKSSDSITPLQSQPEQRSDSQALISELEGTDWFTPEQSPMAARPQDAKAVLVPFGFAPCARDPSLGRLSQEVLQRVLATLNDAVDLAFVGWATSSTTDWQRRLGEIASLAVWQAGAWTGPVPALVDTIVQKLLKPQPDPSSSAVAPEVSALAAAYNTGQGQVAQISLAAQRALLENPALFSDAKAMLLTRVDFVTSATSKESPPEGTLARAQFKRQIRPSNSRTDKSQVALANQDTPAQVNVSLGWRQIVAAGLPGDDGTTSKLGFFEFLDDARYDNAFSVSVDDQQFESFELMINPQAKGAAKWLAAPPIVPGLEENSQAPTKPREVLLASRAIIEAPEFLWSGVSDRLAAAVRGVSIGQTGWSLQRLVVGKEPDPKTVVGDLTVAAFRKDSKTWNKSLTADQLLVHFIYRVTGDEEALAAIDSDSFDNDGFFLRAQRSANSQSFGAAVSLARRIPEGAEKTLRRFLEVKRGSDEAGVLAADSLIQDPSLLGVLQGLVSTESAPEIQKDMVLMKPYRVGSKDADLCVGGNSATLDRIRDICVLRPTLTNASGGRSNSIAYLVVTVALDVWTGWDVTLMHGRNLPFQEWASTCKQATGRVAAPFNRSFWQATDQSSRPATQHLSKVVGNSYADWNADKQAHRVFRVPPEWRGKPVSTKDLLDRILFKELLIIGRTSNQAKTILDSSAASLIYSLPLSVSVYQEQFAMPRDRPQPVRFPFPSVVCRPGEESRTNVWFPEEYATFSIDVRWLRTTGSSPLGIERIFAMAE